MVRKVLTCLDFKRWLDGQIVFGIDEHKRADYIGRYLAQHKEDVPDENFRNLIRRVPVQLTPKELLDVL